MGAVLLWGFGDLGGFGICHGWTRIFTDKKKLRGDEYGKLVKPIDILVLVGLAFVTTY